MSDQDDEDEDYLRKTVEETLSGEHDDDIADPHWDPVLDEPTFEKGRRYISDPSEAPDDAEVHEGPEGGLYIETEGGEPVTGEGGDGAEGAGDATGDTGGAPASDVDLPNAGHTYEDLIPNGGDGPGNIVQVEERLNDLADDADIDQFEESMREGATVGEALLEQVDEETAEEILTNTYGFEDAYDEREG